MRTRKELIGVFSGFPDHHFSEEITKRLREEHARRRSIVFITARPTDYAQNDDDCDGMHEMFADRGINIISCVTSTSKVQGEAEVTITADLSQVGLGIVEEIREAGFNVTNISTIKGK